MSKKAGLLHLKDRKSEELLLLLMGLSVFDSNYAMCSQRREEKKNNRTASVNGEGLEEVHITGLQICLLNILECFETVSPIFLM